MPIVKSPFGGYTNVVNVVSAAAQTTILAEIDKFLALLPNSVTGVQGHIAGFDKLPVDLEVQLRAEVAALKAAIDAAPTV